MYTYLASATASSMTHCASGGRLGVGDALASPLSSFLLLGCDGDGEIARCRCFRDEPWPLPFALALALDVLGIADPAPGNEVSGLCARGGGPLPPSSTTHCARYVFLMWEKMCRTSPAGTIFTTLRAPAPAPALASAAVAAVGPAGVGLVSGRGRRVFWLRVASCSVSERESCSCSSSVSDCVCPLETRRDRDGELAGRGETRSAERSVFAILASAGRDVPVAMGTSAAVGNSCRPARSPKRQRKPSRKQIQELAPSIVR